MFALHIRGIMNRVSLSIVAVIVCIAFLTVAIAFSFANNNSNANTTPSPTANPTESTTTPNSNTPIPNGTQTPNVTFSYHENSRTEIANNTRLVLSINATLISGDSVTVERSNFLLYVWIQGSDGSIGLMNMHHYNSIEFGTVTLDSVDRTVEFVLTYQFPTEVMGFDGYIVPFSSYSLSYMGQEVDLK